MFINKVDLRIIFNSLTTNKVFFNSWSFTFKLNGLDEHLLKLYPSLSFSICLHTLISIHISYFFIISSLTSLHVNDCLQFFSNEANSLHMLLFWTSLLFIIEWFLFSFLLNLKSFIILLNCWFTNLK